MKDEIENDIDSTALYNIHQISERFHLLLYVYFPCIQLSAICIFVFHTYVTKRKLGGKNEKQSQVTHRLDS